MRLRPPRCRVDDHVGHNRRPVKHVPAKRVLYSPQSRDKETHAAYNEFLDMVCHDKGKPTGGDVIKVKQVKKK